MEFKQLIIEGKYDSMTRKVAKDVMKQVRATKKMYDMGLQKKDMKPDEYHVIDMGNYTGIVDFEFYLNIKRTDLVKSTKFGIQAFASTDKTEAAIELYLDIWPDSEPKIYNKLLSHIIDAIRHELEHLTQSGMNKLPGKPRKTGSKIRDKIDSGELPTFKYFTLKDEIPAMVRGMHKQAKHEKKPLDSVLLRYLNYQKSTGVINDIEIKKIMKIWLEYAFKKLPKAKYSKDVEKWLK